MAEVLEYDNFTRAAFISGVALGAASLLLPLKRHTSEQILQNKTQFASMPTWKVDFRSFPDGKLDETNWNIVSGNKVADYNHEAQTYTAESDNVRIEKGMLIIEAKKENKDGRHYTSGRIDTQGKFSFKYGKLEIALKLPSGTGTWPAAWLLPNKPKYNSQKYDINDPNNGWLINGEIDFVEAVGAIPGVVYPAAHTFNSIKTDASNAHPAHINVQDDANKFHNYGIEKLPGSITFTLDGMPYHQLVKTSNNPKDWPFDQSFFLVIDLAMGGSWGGQEKTKFPPDGIDRSSGPWKLEVSTINYYDRLIK